MPDRPQKLDYLDPAADLRPDQRRPARGTRWFLLLLLVVLGWLAALGVVG